MLTNIVSGHHQWDEGIKTVDEISSIYDCEKIKVNPSASQIDYVLGVYRGIVRAVLKVEGYEWTSYDAESKVYFSKERCCFYGVLIADSPYLNKDVNDYPFGSGGAIRYV